MANRKQIQALAIRGAVERASKIGVPCILDRAFGDLEAAMAKVVEEDATAANGAARGQFVADLASDDVTGYVKTSTMLIKFAAGKIAVSTRG